MKILSLLVAALVLQQPSTKVPVIELHNLQVTVLLRLRLKIAGTVANEADGPENEVSDFQPRRQSTVCTGTGRKLAKTSQRRLVHELQPLVHVVQVSIHHCVPDNVC